MSQQDWSECFYCEKPLTDIEDMRIIFFKDREIASCIKCYEWHEQVGKIGSKRK